MTDSDNEPISLLGVKHSRMTQQGKSALVDLAENCPPDLPDFIDAPMKKKTGEWRIKRPS